MERDRQVEALAEEQHGLVARWQLRPLGVDRNLERRRVTAGRWTLEDQKVVRLAGAPRTPEQRLMVKVLAAGPDAVASHHAAAWLWSLPGFAPSDEVIRPRRSYAGPGGHRPRLELPDHHTLVRGVPCTSLPWTLFCLAGCLPMARTARLVDTVVGRSPAILRALHDLLPVLARPGRDGIRVMRALVEERPVGTVVPASGNERRFEQLMRNAGIGGFERQVDVGGHSWLGRVDYRRLDLRLVVEVDSRTFHTSVTDRAHDATRDAAMLAAGWRKVLRVWEEDLWHAPWTVVDTVRSAIAELSGVRNASGMMRSGPQSA